MTTIRHEAVVPLAAAGRRFDQTVAEMFPDYSRSRLAGAGYLLGQIEKRVTATARPDA